jgi:hypothetical protein
MKTLLTIFTLVFTLMFSSTSFAKWTEAVIGVEGDIYYVDIETIRKHDGYVYFWSLMDYLRPSPQGQLSVKKYHQVDCEIIRMKVLSYVFHQQPMGRDAGETSSPKNPEWKYPPPGSVEEVLLQQVCRVTE